MHLELYQTSMMEFFCEKFKFMKYIWHGPNAFELVDVCYHKEIILSLTMIFECCECFRKFMAKLIAFFEKGEGRQPTITCSASYMLVLRQSRVLMRTIL